MKLDLIPFSGGGGDYDLIIHVVDYDHATLEKGNYADLYEKVNNREVINGVLLWDQEDTETVTKLTKLYRVNEAHLTTASIPSPVYFNFANYNGTTEWYVTSDNSIGTTD